MVPHEFQLLHLSMYGQNHGTLVRLCICYVYNITLARRDAYLAHTKSGIKLDSLAALHQTPLDKSTLFPHNMLKKRRISQSLKTGVALILVPQFTRITIINPKRGQVSIMNPS